MKGWLWVFSILLLAGGLSFVLNVSLDKGHSQAAYTPAMKQGEPPEREPSKAVISNGFIEKEYYDVVLLGSELEGIYLARGAADEGLRVKVIDPRKHPGGQLLQGEMFFLDEVRDDKGRSLIQGRFKELFDGFKSRKIRTKNEFQDYYERLREGIPFASGIQIEKIVTDTGSDGQKKIQSIVYLDENKRKKQIYAGYWVENSDFSALVSRLEAERIPGLEKVYGLKRPEFMAATMMMKFKNVDWNRFQTSFNGLKPSEKQRRYGWGYINDDFAISLVGMSKRYQPSNDRVFLRGLNALNQGDGKVIINALLIYDVNPADGRSVSEALELGKRETKRVLEHFRKSMDGWENAEIDGYPPYLYIREYNRYETEYVLEASDLLSGRMFWDNVSIGGYPLDLQGTKDVKWGIEMGRPDKYGMPLRSFLLKNYNNVIVAGKNVGASAIAYGSARIQANTSLAAESIGIILGQTFGKKNLKSLTEQDMEKMHVFLRERYGIRLTGVHGNNKIAGWNEEEIRQLNAGKIVYPAYAPLRNRDAKGEI